MQSLYKKIINQDRITPEECLNLLEKAPLEKLGLLAHQRRIQKTDPEIVTYNIDRNINYTNFCDAYCKFCAFYVHPKSKDGYIIDFNELDQKCDELIQVGGNQILLQGGLHPDLNIDYYENLLQHIKSRYPQMWIHGFSAPEIIKITEVSGLSISKVLKQLTEAGLDSLPGGGAEILVDRVRKELALAKCSTEQWLDVHKIAHEIGMSTTATMMFGHVETPMDIIEHLKKLRELQDKTGGFTAFITWTFQPDNTALMRTRKTTSYEYLKMLALSRIFLDNIKNFQSSWVTQGPKIGQLSLWYGANDMGSTMMEENVVSKAGTTYMMNETEIKRLIKQAGFTAHRRTMQYQLI